MSEFSVNIQYWRDLQSDLQMVTEDIENTRQEQAENWTMNNHNKLKELREFKSWILKEIEEAKSFEFVGGTI